MNEQGRPSLSSRPLVRVTLCCCLCGLMVIGGIAAANFFRNDGKSGSTNLSALQIDAVVTNATALCEQEDYVAAVELLNPVLRALFQQKHIVGLKTYATAQEMVPRDNNAHITLAASTLVHIAELDSNDLAVRLRLFELFRQLGDNTAACQFGDEAVALAKDNNKLRLRVARTHLHADQPQVAQQTAEAILKNHPRHMGAASLIIECMVAKNIASTSILAFIDNVCSQQHNTAQLDRALLSLVLANATNDLESEKLLTSILTFEGITKPLDGDRTKMLATAFESAGRTHNALQVVELAHQLPAPNDTDTEASHLELLNRYLWAGEHQRLQQSIRQSVSDGKNVSDSILVTQFISCWLNHQRSELPKLANQLSARHSHRARCWQPVVAALAATDTTSRQMLSVVTNALRHYPQSPVLQFVQATALQSIGDLDAAAAAYRVASAMSPRWSTPRIGLSRLHLDRHQSRLAFCEAVEAVRAAPHCDEATNALILSAAKLQADGGALQEEIQQAIQKTVQQARSRTTNSTSSQILMATSHAFDNKTKAADDLINQLLLTPDGLSAVDFELLSTIASTEHMKREIDVIRAAKVGATLTAHLAQTVRLLKTATPNEAREYLHHPQRNAGQPLPAVTQALLLTEALSAINSPDAKAAWRKLAAQYDNDLQIQTRAANAPQLASDFEQRQVIVDRMQAISLPDGILWQVEATRLLLDQDTTEQAAARAALTMTDVLATVPTATSAYLLAVRAYERLGKRERVLTLCRNAISHGVMIPRLMVYLAETTKSRDEAVRTARSIVTSHAFTELQVQQGIAVLLQHRDYDFAAQTISRILPATADDSDEYFRQFSAFAIAKGNSGSVSQVTSTIQSLAPKSDRWFQLWLDISQTSNVPPNDASAMLELAAAWLSTDQPHRHRSLSVAWRRLTKRSRNPQYLIPAYNILDAVVTADSSADQQMVLAGLALKTNHRDAAMRLYQQVVEHHATDTPACSCALNNLAALKLESPGELRTAATLAVQAYALQQKPEIMDTLIAVRLRQNRRQDAIRLLNEGLQKWPRNPHLKRLATQIHAGADSI